MHRIWLFLPLLSACAKPPAPVPAGSGAPAFVENESDFEPFKGTTWQNRFKEKPQTYEDYVANCGNRKSAERQTLYIQPLGKISASHRRAIDRMRDYAEIFFGVTSKVCEPMPMFENMYSESRGQYNSRRIISQLTDRVPKDAIVYIGITDGDLFSPGLNFVFGEGSLKDRTGIYSLHRYDTPDAELFLRRALKLMAHEVGHIFSLDHCVTWQCLMNGANSLDEDDRTPMQLCPVDLRKLQWNLGFDPLDRYRRLRDFYVTYGLKEEAHWTENHLKKLAR